MTPMGLNLNSMNFGPLKGKFFPQNFEIIDLRQKENMARATAV